MAQGRLTREMWVLALLFVVGAALPWLTSQDPLAVDLERRLLWPGWQHLLGTDDLGRDMLSRVLHGFSTTVTVSIAALVSALAIGVVSGGVAGYYFGRWPDGIFNWVVNVLMSLPFLLVMASLLSLTTPSLQKAYVVLAGVMWVGPARIVRAEVAKTLTLDYVTAARAIGSSESRILFRTVLPSCTRSATLFSFTYLPEVIGLEAGLSFLGLGAQPPTPALGKMIFDGLAYIYSAWWLALFPAAALFVLVLAVNLMVMSIRDPE